jgi:aryl-alcohol dehydrogenase-like predicted oxidoreductase
MMEYRRLGESDLEVSTIGFGCWGISGGSMWGDQDEAESIAALQAGLDHGITFYDTAEAYGDGYSEEIIGRALSDRRDRIVLATKVSPAHLEPDRLVESCEASLRRLRTDSVDLYQIHWPAPPGDPDAVAQTLLSLQRDGKIRYAGVSNFGPVDLDRYPAGLFVSNQVAYSVAFRAIEHHLVGASVSRGMSIIAYSVLLHGILAGKYRRPDDIPEGRGRTRHFSSTRNGVRHGEDGHEELLFALIDEMDRVANEAGLTIREVAMLWVLGQDGVATILAGSRTPAHAAENARVADQSLDPSLVERLTRASDDLKQAMGPNPDMWQSESRVSW